MRNFEVIFGQGLDFDGSIFVASGGAKLFPNSSAFSAIIMDRNCYGNTISANIIAHDGRGVDLRDARYDAEQYLAALW